ncbi:MAG: apolipoprotein N-acyltransferase [Alphaproteobacteria bacterium]|nr:apolipoprotein N-acyltransferase [Alphaproteobacteria bacterium]
MDFPHILLKPWPQRGIAFLLGGIGALAFAPTFVLPALLLALSGIWFLLEQEIEHDSSFFRIFWLGWWFGLGHFTVGLYWIANALTVDLEAFWWLIPFALLGIPAILGIFTGLSFALTKIWPFGGLSRGFAFAAIWVGVEWLRGHLFTGFPWNLAGYAWAFSPEMMQAVSFSGVYGLSLLTLLMAISLSYFVGKGVFERNISFTIYLIATLIWVWGKVRLDHPDVLPSQPMAIRLVQPNIPQTLKWDPQQKEAHFQKLLEMSEKPSIYPLKAIIWPESAVSYFLEYDAIHRFTMAKTLPQGALLFTGAPRRSANGVIPFQIWNSLLVINDEGNIVAHYDKSHLVPFGEYLPFRSVLDSFFGKGTIKKITAGTLDFTPGSGPTSVSLPNDFPPFSGLVCYEVIFPGAVVNSKQIRPGWMINLTNDAWYGNSSGPYQHFEIARFRAVEEGLPLVRVANSGISAVFDSYGRIIGIIGLDQKGILDVFLPAPTRLIPFYGRWGDLITLTFILGILALAWLFSLRKRNDQ